MVALVRFARACARATPQFRELVRSPRVQGMQAADQTGPSADASEQDRCICTGGHFTEPNEQNTQQSPAFGRSNTLQ